VVVAEQETCNPAASASGLKSVTPGPSRPGMVFCRDDDRRGRGEAPAERRISRCLLVLERR
jgi:hypothetical protein